MRCHNRQSKQCGLTALRIFKEITLFLRFVQSSTSLRSFFLQQCKAQCKPPCSYWQFQKTVSYAHFPAKHTRFFVENDSEWESLQNTIILEVSSIYCFLLLTFAIVSVTVAAFNRLSEICFEIYQ